MNAVKENTYKREFLDPRRFVQDQADKTQIIINSGPEIIRAVSQPKYPNSIAMELKGKVHSKSMPFGAPERMNNGLSISDHPTFLRYAMRIYVSLSPIGDVSTFDVINIKATQIEQTVRKNTFCMALINYRSVPNIALN